MGWREEQRQRDEALAAELARLGNLIEDLKPKVASREPGEPAPRTPCLIDWMRVGVAFCRDGDTSLLAQLKPVPVELAGERVRSGDYGLHVACPCGAELDVTRRLEPCAGCGRWYVGDVSGVWAVRLPAAA